MLVHAKCFLKHRRLLLLNNFILHDQKLGLLTVFKPEPIPRFSARTEENQNPNFSSA